MHSGTMSSISAKRPQQELASPRRVHTCSASRQRGQDWTATIVLLVAGVTRKSNIKMLAVREASSAKTDAVQLAQPSDPQQTAELDGSCAAR